MKRFMLFASITLVALIFAGCEDPQSASAVPEDDPKFDVVTCTADVDCGEGFVCTDGVCAEAPAEQECVADCENKACGDDGCGGTCGEGLLCGETNQCECPEGTSLDATGACVAPVVPILCKIGFVKKDGKCTPAFWIPLCKSGFKIKNGKCMPIMLIKPLNHMLLLHSANAIK